MTRISTRSPGCERADRVVRLGRQPVQRCALQHRVRAVAAVHEPQRGLEFRRIDRPRREVRARRIVCDVVPAATACWRSDHVFMDSRDPFRSAGTGIRGRRPLDDASSHRPFARVRCVGSLRIARRVERSAPHQPHLDLELRPAAALIEISARADAQRSCRSPCRAARRRLARQQIGAHRWRAAARRSRTRLPREDHRRRHRSVLRQRDRHGLALVDDQRRAPDTACLAVAFVL